MSAPDTWYTYYSYRVYKNTEIRTYIAYVVTGTETIDSIDAVHEFLHHKCCATESSTCQSVFRRCSQLSDSSTLDESWSDTSLLVEGLNWYGSRASSKADPASCAKLSLLIFEIVKILPDQDGFIKLSVRESAMLPSISVHPMTSYEATSKIKNTILEPSLQLRTIHYINSKKNYLKCSAWPED